MLISGHDMWVFVGERGIQVEMLKFQRKKKLKDGYKPEKEV